MKCVKLSFTVVVVVIGLDSLLLPTGHSLVLTDTTPSSERCAESSVFFSVECLNRFFSESIRSIACESLRLLDVRENKGVCAGDQFSLNIISPHECSLSFRISEFA